MKKARIMLSVAVLVLTTLGLASYSGPREANAAAVSQSVVPVYTTPDGFLLGDQVPGAYARLLRTDNGITTNLHTTVEAGGVYSLWWVVFNHPENCQTYLCTFDEPDLVLNASGHPVSPSEASNLSARLDVGGPYKSEIIYEGPEPALTNPDGALVLLVLRYHGETPTAGGSKEFRSYLFGCPDGGSPCVDAQLAVFPGDCSGLCLVPFP
jgi:hypothetical protein